jgi:hypothetical protein
MLGLFHVADTQPREPGIRVRRTLLMRNTATAFGPRRVRRFLDEQVTSRQLHRNGNLKANWSDSVFVTHRYISVCTRAAFGIGLTGGLLLTAASTALAHSEFDVDEVAPGSIVSLNLFVENESDSAGTTMVELRFPQLLTIVDLPTVGCWQGEPVDGAIGEEAIGVVWTRPTAEPTEDPVLPLTIGPLPATEGRLQFKVVQTYSDGSEDAWIDEWREGEPEPPHPGPILDLVAGAPGTIPSSSEETAPGTTPAASAPQLTITETTPTETTALGTGDTIISVSDSSMPVSSPLADCG